MQGPSASTVTPRARNRSQKSYEKILRSTRWSWCLSWRSRRFPLRSRFRCCSLVPPRSAFFAAPRSRRLLESRSFVGQTPRPIVTAAKKVQLSPSPAANRVPPWPPADLGASWGSPGFTAGRSRLQRRRFIPPVVGVPALFSATRKQASAATAAAPASPRSLLHFHNGRKP